MRLLFSIALFFLLFSCNEEKIVDPPGTEPTELSGQINGTLSYGDHPFIIVGNVEVPKDQTLIIEAGCKLFFKDTTQFKIYGKLIANGIKGQPIKFIAYNNTTWNGIFADSSAEMELNFCEITNVITDQTKNDGGALTAINSKVIIKNSIFKNNQAMQGGALFFKNCKTDITNTLIIKNSAEALGGAILASQSKLTLTNLTISQNHSDNYGGAIVLIAPTETTVQNTLFYENSHGGGSGFIDLYSGDSTGYVHNFNFFNIPETDPKFISETDFHLQTSSPCRNMGNPINTFNNSDGTRNDIGAYGGPLGDW